MERIPASERTREKSKALREGRQSAFGGGLSRRRLQGPHRAVRGKQDQPAVAAALKPNSRRETPSGSDTSVGRALDYR